MTMRKAAVAGLLIATALPTSAWAQASADERADAADVRGEIVVTARRREEALSKVPLAVTALSGEMLAAKSIRNENDLQSAVPGLVIKQNGSANAFNYVIRGQTIDTYTNSPPGVLPYINEAQIVSYSASSFYDLANIQVLKGPQGTLFGRNTTGGAVLYQTAQPKDTVGGYLQGRYGNLDAYQVQGAVNLPLSDSVRLRVAGSKTGGGAYVRRLDNNTMTGNLEQTSVRGTLLIEPSPGFRNTTVVQHTSDGGTNAANSIYHSSAYAGCPPGLGGTNPRAIADCFYGGYPYGLLPKASPFLALGVVGLSNRQDQLGPWEVIGVNTDLRHQAKSTFVINTTEYDVSDNLKFKNIFMYNESWSIEANDYDGSPFPLIGITGNLTPDLTNVTNPGRFYNKTKQISEEFQIQGKALDSRLDYTVGFYYMHQVNTFDSEVSFFNFFPVGPDVKVHYAQESRSDSFAGFAQGTYALTDELNFTAGIRYTRDKTQARQLPGSDWYGCGQRVPNVCKAVGTPPEYLQSKTASKPSWNVSLDYKATPSLMFYVTTRGSWRSGGFNYTLPPNPLSAEKGGSSFAPETTQDVEVGLKYSGRDMGFPATFNLDFYNQWVKNIQRGANIVSPISGTSILTTIAVPKAVISGVEADFTLSPAPWLSFGGSLSYTHARFTENRVTIPGNPPLLYGPYADVPEWAGSAFAELSHQFADDRGTLSLRVDYYEQSKSYFSNLNDTLIPGTDIAGYRLVNGRLAWSDVLGSKITVAAFARNIFNQRYYTGGNGTGLSAGFNSAYPGVPRTYGIEVNVGF